MERRHKNSKCHANWGGGGGELIITAILVARVISAPANIIALIGACVRDVTVLAHRSTIKVLACTTVLNTESIITARLNVLALWIRIWSDGGNGKEQSNSR
jgi:hypothetical protein